LTDFLGGGLYVSQESYINWGQKRMNRIEEYAFETGLDSPPVGDLREFQNLNRFICETIQLRKPSLKNVHPAQYLSSVEPYIPKELISSQNYTKIKELASCFSEGITSFFGFETRLNTGDGRSDYLFAISSQGGEREKLLDLVTNRKLPQSFYSTIEWKNIGKFVSTWADPTSVLHNSILGLWFEFDIVDDLAESPIPCVFIHTVPLNKESIEETYTCAWLTGCALPLLTGEPVPQSVEQNVLQAIQGLPEGSSIFQVGVMLSRATAGVRLVLNKIKPAQIIPYLTALGWEENDDRLSSLIGELEQYATSIVLHITVGENGVDPKIGLECSFYPHLYNFESKWPVFFEYLVKTGLCRLEKKNAVLQFPGVKSGDIDFFSNLVRFISHIKLVYTPQHPVEAKVYSGVRLFRSSLGQQRDIREKSIEHCKGLATYA
jgi:hypothetical protein